MVPLGVAYCVYHWCPGGRAFKSGTCRVFETSQNFRQKSRTVAHAHFPQFQTTTAVMKTDLLYGRQICQFYCSCGNGCVCCYFSGQRRREFARTGRLPDARLQRRRSHQGRQVHRPPQVRDAAREGRGGRRRDATVGDRGGAAESWDRRVPCVDVTRRRHRKGAAPWGGGEGARPIGVVVPFGVSLIPWSWFLSQNIPLTKTQHYPLSPMMDTSVYV